MNEHIQAGKLFSVDGKPEIDEAGAAGAGRIQFEPACQCHVFRPGSEPIGWLRNKKCGDGAILVADGNECSGIHLVELKSRISASGWLDIKAQLEGLLHNVRALYAIAGAKAPESVKAYVAFKRDLISRRTTTASVLGKTTVGPGAHTFGPSTDDWESCSITLLGEAGVPLIRIQRDDAGNATTSLA